MSIFKKTKRIHKKVHKGVNEFPIRNTPLGHSKQIPQGVAGWRSNYYRLSELHTSTPTSSSWMELYIKSLNNK